MKLVIYMSIAMAYLLWWTLKAAWYLLIALVAGIAWCAQTIQSSRRSKAAIAARSTSSPAIGQQAAGALAKRDQPTSEAGPEGLGAKTPVTVENRPVTESSWSDQYVQKLKRQASKVEES